MCLVPKQPGGILPVLLAVVFLALPAAAADGVIKIYQSTFNELGDKLTPIHFESPTNGSAHPIWWPWGEKLCAGDWRAKVTGVNFVITPSQVRIMGTVEATWTCVFDFPLTGMFNTTGNVSYSASQNAVRVTVNPVTLQLAWNGPFGIQITQSIRIDQGLNIPPIPVTTASFHFETARGPARLRLTPHNIVVIKRSGYIELQADVRLW